MKRRITAFLCFSLITFVISGPIVHAAEKPVRIGAIVDLSGAYSDLAGPGVVVAMQMAVEDFGGKVLGRPIEVLASDSLMKADVASSRAREWFDQQNVQMILESSDSATALALQRLAKAKKRLVIFTSGTTALTNKQCSPYGVQWAWNTYAMANVTARALSREGAETWYFIAADYTFGESLEQTTSSVVEEMDGQVVGVARVPLNTNDFSSYLITAQSSNADVIALANAGKDTQNAIRQAKEFRITSGETKVAPLILFSSDVKGMGLDLAQRLQFTTAFYWDRTAESRKWSERFFERRELMPTMNQAGAYSAVLHYLKSIDAAGTLDTDAVMKQMRKIPVQDFFAENGTVREDGLMEHDMYLAEVKSPQVSTGPWDLLTIRQTISGSKAFQPLSESSCPLVEK